MENEQIMGSDTGSVNIHFAWLEEKGFVSSYKETKLFFDYDVDKIDDEHWEFHIDTGMILDNVFEHEYRSSQIMRTNEEKIYTRQWLGYFLKSNIMTMKDDFEDKMKEANKHYNIDEIYCIEKDLDPFADSIWDNGKWKALGKGGERIFEKSYPFPFHSTTQLATIVVSNVMNDIFFWNPHFDRLGNQERLKHYIHAPAFFTLNSQMIKFSEEQKTMELKWKYFIIFYLSINCVCHLMLSDHAEYLQPQLDKMGANKEAVNQFLKWAQMYVNTIQQDLKKNKTNIEVLNMQIDWDKLVW